MLSAECRKKYKVQRTKYEVRGTKYVIKLMSNTERRVQNLEVEN